MRRSLTKHLAISLGTAILLAVVCGGLQFATEQRHSKSIPNEQFLALWARADTAVIGRVNSFGVCPDQYSGYATAYQTVSYAVLRVLKGECQTQQLVVQHPVVESALNTSRHMPCLDPQIFASGRDLVVLTARCATNSCNAPYAMALDGDFGAIPVNRVDMAFVAELTTLIESGAAASGASTREPRRKSDRLPSPCATISHANTGDTLRLQKCPGLPLDEIGPEFFHEIAGEEYFLQTAMATPSGDAVAIPIVDSTGKSGRGYVAVIDLRSLGRSVIIDAAEVSRDNAASGTAYGARSPLWLNDDEVAFLSGNRGGPQPAVFVSDWRRGGIASYQLSGVPVTMQWSEGVLRCRTSAGEEIIRVSR